MTIPGDKSISHRAVMFGSLAKGTTNISNFLDGEDCLRTIDIFKAFGVDIEQHGQEVTIKSNGVESFAEPKTPLYFGNSGTTARLMLGILSAIPYFTVLHGDPHLTMRPMERVVTPLKLMGAAIYGREDDAFLPMATKGKRLRGIDYTLPVKSAQVKSAVLLAGLFADGKTSVTEQAKTRDHTENMLLAFGADIKTNGLSTTITNKNSLQAVNVIVPGDISSAAFFMVAAAIVPNSTLTLCDVGLNETRTGIIDVFKRMGANIRLTNEREVSGEWMGDITVTYGDLQAVEIEGDIIPTLIDEIPIIALLATQAEGTTVIRNAEELRVKETDRIQAVVEVLSTLGAHIEEKEDGMVIYGKTKLTGGEIKSYSDHRMAMMGVIASLICTEPVKMDDVSSIAISYPTFFQDLNKVTHIEK